MARPVVRLLVVGSPGGDLAVGCLPGGRGPGLGPGLGAGFGSGVPLVSGVPVLVPALPADRRRGEGPDVHRVGDVVRVAALLLPFGRARLQVLGVSALHARPSGQQPDGGAEAFRRTGLVQLVLPTEPHRHQVGGPGPDDDCVDEAAAAHASHGRGVCMGASANCAGVSHDLADISSFFPTEASTRRPSSEFNACGGRSPINFEHLFHFGDVPGCPAVFGPPGPAALPPRLRRQRLRRPSGTSSAVSAKTRWSRHPPSMWR